MLGDRYGSRDFAGLADGVHVFRVIVTDTAGRTAVDADAHQWRIDTSGLGVLLPDDATAPTVAAPAADITSGQPVGTTTAPVRIRWTSQDGAGAGAGIQRHDVQRSVAGGGWAAVTSPGAGTAAARQPLYLRNGLSPSTSHVLEVRSLGIAGHTGGGTRVAVDAVSILR